jgi:hypothetical protein
MKANWKIGSAGVLKKCNFKIGCLCIVISRSCEGSCFSSTKTYDTSQIRTFKNIGPGFDSSVFPVWIQENCTGKQTQV